MSDKMISIIIVNYQSKKRLDGCLTSIFGNILSKISGEVILVNNDSNETLEEYINRFNNLRILNNRENAGFSRACNQGAGIAQGEILLFLNPDTEILSDNIEDVLKILKTNNSIVGARLIDSQNKTHRWSAGRKINLYDLLRNNLQIPRSKKIWNSKNSISADWVSGTSLFIKKKDFEKLNGFDENFFMYFEDIDLCRRAKKGGLKIIYYPTFSIFHFGGESYGDKFEQKDNYFASQEYYFKKHCGPLQTMLLKILRKIFI
ncbi:MAG TPA: glycosyltransferase family 2 protein [Patescibacteria group bacterium]|nr:glycosyltransferase family 2 protein [Patescibacteria group bacterium]